MKYIALLLLLVTLLVTPITTHATEPVTLSGWLSAYDAEPSEATMMYRSELEQIQWGYHVYIATASCEYVGWHGTMRYDDGRELTVQVFDCSGHDAEPGTAVIESVGFVGELDYASWQHYGLGRVVIELSK